MSARQNNNPLKTMLTQAFGPQVKPKLKPHYKQPSKTNFISSTNQCYKQTHVGHIWNKCSLAGGAHGAHFD